MRVMLGILLGATVAAVPPPSVGAVPAAAVRMAAVDLRNLKHDRRYAGDPAAPLFVRYLWNRQPDRAAELKACALTLNYVSRAEDIASPSPRFGGQLIRVDLRDYGRNVADRNDWLRLWEEFRFDPWFGVIISPDTVKQLKLSGVDPVVRVRRHEKIPCEPYTVGGATFDYKWGNETVTAIPVSEATDDDGTLRADAPHADPEAWAELRAAMNTEAPVVESRYFRRRAMTAIRGKGLYRSVYGGLYYDLIGIDRNPKGDTAEDALYKRLTGFGLAELIKRFSADGMVGMFRSGVTGKPRQVLFVPIQSVRITRQIGILSITLDSNDEDIDTSQHAIYTLLNVKPAGKEVIWVQPNGMHGFALFNGAGGLVDEAPKELVHDRLIPAPHTGRLEPAISCVRCHGIDGSDGWKPVVNNVEAITVDEIAAFGDLSEKDEAAEDTVKRIKAKFGGSPGTLLRRGREDLAANVLRITGPMPGGKGDQTDINKLIVEYITREHERDVYDMVTPAVALAELGYSGEKGQELATLRALLPARLVPPVDTEAGRMIPENPVLGALKRGVSVNRADWALVYSFAATRAADARRAMTQEGAK